MMMVMMTIIVIIIIIIIIIIRRRRRRRRRRRKKEEEKFRDRFCRINTRQHTSADNVRKSDSTVCRIWVIILISLIFKNSASPAYRMSEFSLTKINR
jgi:UDP-N-acetylmuramyl pentapeptide phosphotransferase/UDP-N-acetylglucosamine-1-phosphate transferase